MISIDCCGSQTERRSVTDTTQREICAKHQTVFGENTQSRISDLTIGVVSVGGLGSIIIEQLMRLFPRKLVYIDNDHIELSNLNRLVGATKIDATLQTSKVDIISRNILTFNPDQQIVSIFGNFLDREHLEQFKECDLIIGASDSNAVRIAANCLCLAHGIPYLDCGVGAVVDDSGLTAAGGQIIKVLPDSGFCLQCGGFFDVPEAMKEFLPESERTRLENLGYIRGENVAAPQVYSLNMIVASWVVWTFMRMASGETLEFDGIAIDAKDFKTHTWNEETTRRRDCPTCSPSGIVFGGDDVDLLSRERLDLEIEVPQLDGKEITAGFSSTTDTTQKSKDKIEREMPIPASPGAIIGEQVGNPFCLGIFGPM